MNPLLIPVSAFLFWWAGIILFNFMSEADTKVEYWLGMVFAYLLMIAGVACLVV